LVEESLDDPERFRAELGRLIARIGAPDDHDHDQDQDQDHDEER
jgi:hypothetical protein